MRNKEPRIAALQHDDPNRIVAFERAAQTIHLADQCHVEEIDLAMPDRDGRDTLLERDADRFEAVIVHSVLPGLSE